MAIKDAHCSNSPATVHALAGELIVGTFLAKDGVWYLVVQSGHAFCFSNNGSFWTKSPKEVQEAIREKVIQLGSWTEEMRRLMHFPDPATLPMLVPE